jgi:hypothetical protein
MSNLTSRIDRLKSLLVLEEKRAALQLEVDELHRQITTIRDHLFDEAPTPVAQPAAKVARKSAPKGRAQRGALKASILSALEAAGHAGVRVTELAGSLGTKAANLHAWFHSTAKKLPQIVKVAGGHYRLNGLAPQPAKASTAAATTKKPAKAVKPAKASKPGRAKRGALTENILVTLGEAGSQGISIKDVSAKVGAHYRNVAVWFATTGKKNPKIKKVAPATYKLAA